MLTPPHTSTIIHSNPHVLIELPSLLWINESVFFCQFCDVSKVTMISKKDLAKFGYKLNMKVKFSKHPSIFLATYLNHVQKSEKIS